MGDVVNLAARLMGVCELDGKHLFACGGVDVLEGCFLQLPSMVIVSFHGIIRFTLVVNTTIASLLPEALFFSSMCNIHV